MLYGTTIDTCTVASSGQLCLGSSTLIASHASAVIEWPALGSGTKEERAGAWALNQTTGAADGEPRSNRGGIVDTFTVCVATLEKGCDCGHQWESAGSTVAQGFLAGQYWWSYEIQGQILQYVEKPWIMPKRVDMYVRSFDARAPQWRSEYRRLSSLASHA